MIGAAMKMILGLMIAAKLGYSVHAYSMCSDKLLGPDQICCGGEIHNKTTRYTECCAGKGLYNVNTHLCCGPQLISLYEGEGQNGVARRCCRDGIPRSTDKVFVPSHEFCCGGLVYPHKDDHTCCGKALINELERSCCRAKNGSAKIVLPFGTNETCCGVSKYNRSTDWCAVKDQILPIGMDVCGSSRYNTTSYACCTDTDTVKEVPANTSSDPYWICKEGHVYDWNTYYWNPEVKRVMEKGKLLCSMKEYDKVTEVCCSDRVYNKSKTANWLCCGNQYINTVSHACCDTVPYSRTEEKCCNSKTRIRRSPQIDCCGPDAYNTSDKVCCWSLIKPEAINKTKPDDTSCCQKGSKPQPYNGYSEDCRAGVGVCPKNLTTTTVTLDKVTEVPHIVTPSSRPGPFCKYGKQDQMKVTCYKRYSYMGYVGTVERSGYKTIFTVHIFRPRKLQGTEVEWHIHEKAKCMTKWENGFVWAFTNRRHKGNKNRGYRLKLTGKDLVMKNTRKNRLLRNWHCRQKTNLIS